MNKNKFARLSKPQKWRVSTVKLLFALILLFAVTPFVENLPNGDFVETGLITLVMVASLVAVGRDHRILILAAVLFVPADVPMGHAARPVKRDPATPVADQPGLRMEHRIPH